MNMEEIITLMLQRCACHDRVVVMAFLLRRGILEPAEVSVDWQGSGFPTLFCGSDVRLLVSISVFRGRAGGRDNDLDKKKRKEMIVFLLLALSLAPAERLFSY
jgi:hypothetical protein